jgi:hypothetical protein
MIASGVAPTKPADAYIHVALVAAHSGHVVVHVAVIHVRVVHLVDCKARCCMKESRCSTWTLQLSSRVASTHQHGPLHSSLGHRGVGRGSEALGKYHCNRLTLQSDSLSSHKWRREPLQHAIHILRTCDPSKQLCAFSSAHQSAGRLQTTNMQLHNDHSPIHRQHALSQVP